LPPSQAGLPRRSATDGALPARRAENFVAAQKAGSWCRAGAAIDRECASMTRSAPHAILLCAGLGSRLLPLTADWPKCLIEVGGRTILEHQLDALAAAGIGGATVVGGYRFDRLAAFVAERWPDPASRPELVFNPFYAISSSIGSVWSARHRLDRPFCVLNGDTIYEPALVAEGLARAGEGVSLFVEPVAGSPEPDDMLVRMDGERVVAVGKTLPPTLARHRSLGFLVGRNDDGAYARTLEQVIGGVDGTQAFHHAIVDRLAHEGPVRGVCFAAGAWTEIDRPEDIARWPGTAAEAAEQRRAAGD
jgi:L-glutamine-phosphate cytidylyltransferase